MSENIVERVAMPIADWLRGHADGIRKQCEGKPLGGQYPVVPYTAQRLDEAANRIAALEAALRERINVACGDWCKDGQHDAGCSAARALTDGGDDDA